MYSPASYHRRRWPGPAKDRERNLPAALLSVLVSVLLCTSLAQPRWFYLKGGSCPRKYVGIYEFFYIGNFDPRFDGGRAPSSSSSSSQAHSADGITGFIYHGYDETLVNCVTPQIVTTFRVVIVFVFFALAASLFAFSLDTFGVMHRLLKVLKRNAVGSIATVVFCVVVVGLCYYVTTLLVHELELSKVNRGTRVEVKFEVGFYLVSAAGAVAVLASAANLLRRFPMSDADEDASSRQGDDDDDDALLDDFDGMETFSVNCLAGLHMNSESEPSFTATGSTSYSMLPPPPPYTP